MTDTPSQAAARAWLHSYGINTSRYTDGGGDHPAMQTLPQAFEAFARGIGPAQVIRLDHIKLPTTIPWVTA